MKIAIGMIVRNLISVHPLTDFLDNAEKYDHPIERVIVVYSHEADSEAIQELQRKAKVSLIRLQNYERAHMVLKQLGVRFSSIQQLLFCPLIDTHGLIPYVTAFLDFKTFKQFSESLAWETEVWIADMPDHMIHLNGDKFLGPRI